MNIALILSGGTGSRLNSDIPKQYIEVKGQLLITYCLRTFTEHEDVDGLWIVCSPEWIPAIKQDLISHNIPTEKIMGFSSPGSTRQLSILNGLNDIEAKLKGVPSAGDPVVIIHDAARPNLTKEDISLYLKELDGHDGLMPALPMKDTVYMSEDGKTISSLLNRSKIYAGQAPELYHLTKYLAATRALLPDKILKINGSTEPAIMSGLDVAIVPGNENNFKITTRADLERL